MKNKRASVTLNTDLKQLYNSPRATEAKYQGLIVNKDLDGQHCSRLGQILQISVIVILSNFPEVKEWNYFQLEIIRNCVEHTL